MKTTNKKLKEFMYLSLLGEYTYMELKNSNFIICFTGARPLCSCVIKPICLTSTNFSSDKIIMQRINSFEDKVLSETSNLHKSQLKGEKIFSLDNRIKFFVEHYYRNNIIFDMYQSNLNSLYKGRVIDETQYLGALKFISKMRDKVAQENNDKLFVK